MERGMQALGGLLQASIFIIETQIAPSLGHIAYRGRSDLKLLQLPGREGEEPDDDYVVDVLSTQELGAVDVEHDLAFCLF